MSAISQRFFWVEAISQRRQEAYRYSAFARGGDLEVRRLHTEGLPRDPLIGVEPGDWSTLADFVGRGFGPIVDTVEWEPWTDVEAYQRHRKNYPNASPGEFRYLRVKRRKTVREVSVELGEYLDGMYDDAIEDELTPFPDTHDLEWPEGRIVCFAVHGSSEGDYIHVEVQEGERSQLLLLAKTFGGRDAAWLLARRAADLLGA